MASMEYAVGSWDAQGLGNHRVVVRAEAPAVAVRVRIPWRRRDARPQRKDVIVVDACSGATVEDVLRLEVTEEHGDLVFAPVSGAGLYWVYFMPHVQEGWQHRPATRYLPPRERAQPEWTVRVCDVLDRDPGSLPQATVVRFEAIRDFHRMDPMEVVATRVEVEALKQRFPSRSYLIFPESRERPIRMRRIIPVEALDAAGARVIHLHHGNPLNPHINYPFLRDGHLRAYATAAHARQMRLVISYTVRELSNHAPELWAFRSLGDGIYLQAPGSRVADHFPDADIASAAASLAADTGASGASTAAEMHDPDLHLVGGSWLWEHLDEGVGDPGRGKPSTS